jgi:hypothetical protein
MISIKTEKDSAEVCSFTLVTDDDNAEGALVQEVFDGEDDHGGKDLGELWSAVPMADGAIKLEFTVKTEDYGEHARGLHVLAGYATVAAGRDAGDRDVKRYFIVEVDTTDERGQAELKLGRRLANVVHHGFGDLAVVHFAAVVDSFGWRLRKDGAVPYRSELDDACTLATSVWAYRAQEDTVPDPSGLDDMEERALLQEGNAP